MMCGDFDGMDIDDLCEWANSLGVCPFEIAGRCGNQLVVAENGSVCIDMRFGRFSESVHGVGGARMVLYSTFDNRDGSYSGTGQGVASLGELESLIVRDAERLGLFGGQLRLF